MTRTTVLRAILLCCCSMLTIALPVSADEDKVINQKVDNLIAKMTLAEKIGQLNQHAGFSDLTGPQDDNANDQIKVDRIRKGLVGSMLNVTGVDEVRFVQKMAVEESRLGIPILFGFDVIHGYKTMFPIPLAEASSWDTSLAQQSAHIAAIEASADGLNWTFAPMVDISREPRWGRVMEGAGEDPFLGSAFAVARVKGFQGDDLSSHDTLLSTVKHFAAYGWTQAGRDYTHAEVDNHTLHNVILPPFKAAIEKGKAMSVMNAFNVRNGVPATADTYLQRQLLKGEWGFEGFVVTDWGSLIEMVPHGFAENNKEAAYLAITAGADMEMETGAYISHLESLVREKRVDESLINDAVRRILTVKFKLGLFDDPYRYLDSTRATRLLSSDTHKHAALKAAERSIVLLKNSDATLPLSGQETLGVIGALAADKDAPIANWRGRAINSSAVSLIEALDAADIDYKYAQGARVTDNVAVMAEPVIVNQTDRSGFSDAINLAKQVDKVVMVLGEVAMQSGEARSRTDIGLPGLQQELLEAIYAVNQNIVLVVMSGRPLVLTWADEHVPTIVQAWHLGSMSGHALVNVLTGAYNPSAKLPMTFPRHQGQVPIYYNHYSTGRPGPRQDVWWSHYIDQSNTPLYPFGHGLSYTSFEYDNLTAEVSDEGIDVTVKVTNTGKRTGEEVVQLYIWDKAASSVRPVRELKGFNKIHLTAGQTKQVSFTLRHNELGFYDAQGVFKVEPGTFEIFVGGSSATRLSKEVVWGR